MGLFGCSKGEELSEGEWNQRLIAALEELDFVTKLEGMTYTKVGMFFSKSGWIGGSIFTNAPDEAATRAALDEVARVIVETHRTNYSEVSRVSPSVYGLDGKPLEFEDVLGKAVVSLDDLAEFYGLPRH